VKHQAYSLIAVNGPVAYNNIFGDQCIKGVFHVALEPFNDIFTDQMLLAASIMKIAYLACIRLKNHGVVHGND
jgi:hypothetical protein